MIYFELSIFFFVLLYFHFTRIDLDKNKKREEWIKKMKKIQIYELEKFIHIIPFQKFILGRDK